MTRLARVIGIVVFLGVELVVLFASYVVASVRCCNSSQRSWPSDAGEWIGLAIFAMVMTIPAALIGAGAAILAEGIRRGIAVILRRDSSVGG